MAIPGSEALKNVDEMIDSKIQVQPNGVDLTIRKVYRLKGVGVLKFRGKELPKYEELSWKSGDTLKLDVGAYVIEYNEIIKVPKDCIAMVFPRSTLLRMGCDLRGALWDSGYVGRSHSLLLVYNPIILHKNARIAQLVFFKVLGTIEKEYAGNYQYENI